METDLNYYRSRIDEIDGELASLLARRFAVVDGIAEYKRGHGLQVYDSSRENSVLQKVALLAGEEYSEDVMAVYQRIFEVSRNRQA